MKHYTKMAKVAFIQEDGMPADKFLVFIKKQPEIDVILDSNKITSILEKRITDCPPDIVLLDISTNGKSSLEFLPQIKAALPKARVLVMGHYLSPDLLLDALKRGADSYFSKSTELRELLKAIKVTVAGGAYLDPQAAKLLVGIFQEISSNALQNNQLPVEYWAGRETFVAREMQVIKGLLSNLSYKEIASNHNVGINTVRYYVKSVYRKLNINSKSQLWSIFHTSAPK
jgi:DNA-binding NarL/FixJ family response regulator